MDWTEGHEGHAEIEPHHVHVWRFSLSDSANTDLDILSNDEQARASDMSSAKARESYLASQSALRDLLSRYMRIRPKDIAFARAAHGKPVLATPSGGLEFNVSHSGNWGVVAVARVAVGVDVEEVRAKGSTPAFENRFLTDGERELLRAREQSHGDAAFFIVWSRKEAFLKATGFGLSAPFSRVDSSADRLPDLDETGSQRGGDMPWTVREFFVDERHPAAVVARAPHISIRLLNYRRTRN